MGLNPWYDLLPLNKFVHCLLLLIYMEWRYRNPIIIWQCSDIEIQLLIYHFKVITWHLNQYLNQYFRLFFLFWFVTKWFPYLFSRFHSMPVEEVRNIGRTRWSLSRIDSFMAMKGKYPKQIGYPDSNNRTTLEYLLSSPGQPQLVLVKVKIKNLIYVNVLGSVRVGCFVGFWINWWFL